jgi:preprotein translocase subunit SecA
MSLISLIFGDANEKTIKALKPIITKINGYEEALKNLSDESLRAKTEEFRAQLGLTMVDGEFVHQHRKAEEAKILDRLLPEAFAVVREASRRVLGQRHYDVQLIGGITLHHGQIAEMKTGEGKTLVETLPLYLNALAGHGVHLITVNDYLSRVGAGWMAPVYHSLGLSTSVIIHEQAFKYDPEYNDDTQFDERLRHFKLIKRQEAYNCDITYGTNNEFGFDYLRDNMAASLSERVQRDLHYAVVDEVDSILIDEARTPLIISGAVDESTDKYYKFTELVSRLVENDDYNVDEKMRTASLTEAGITKMEQWLGVDNIYVTGGIKEVHHIEQALKARVLFHKDKDYVVKDGEVIIVDEFTGRMKQGRRYSEGLHQAIEAKENVQIQRESQTMATVTFQNYFRMYFKLSGMTGTAMTEAEEFYKIYNLDTIAIPTNKPVKRQDLNDLIYATEAGKYQAIVNEIKSRHEKGQPVLVGTISIERNEHLAHLLELEGIPHQVLNAKQHDREALTISQAGKVGGVTIATNMAGRGVDIILGGDPFNQAEHDKVIELGGLHVIGTERHESRRIDNQLRGRAGRQGDPGSSQFYVSMEDDLMRIFGGDRMKNIMQTMKLPADMPIDNRIITKSIESAQKKVEGNNFDTRKHLVEYDDVINKHRETIYERRLRILRLAENKINSEDSSNYQSLTDIILEMVDQEITDVVTFHTSSDELGEWNIKEISDTIATIYPTEPDLQASLQAMLSGDNSKLDRVKIRTKVIDYLFDLAKQKYQDLVEVVSSANVPWSEIEKNILLRSMDLLWIEHLEAMDYMRRGIGLRGYGQRDPLVEYKKEAFRMYSELNSLIQKQTVYSIYKLGGVTQAVESDSLAKKGVIYSAPAKEMTKGSSAFSEGDGGTGPTLKMALNEPKQKAKDESGHKVGRNDPCPCGATKNDGTPIKYKNCHGKA